METEVIKQLDIYKSMDDKKLIAIYKSGALTTSSKSAIETILSERNIPTPNKKTLTDYRISSAIKQSLLDIMYGKEKLSTVFWGYYIAGMFIIGFAAQWIIVLIESVIDSEQTQESVLAVLGFLMLAYLLFIGVGLWRCAWNSNNKAWGYIVRIAILLLIFPILLAIVSPTHDF